MKTVIAVTAALPALVLLTWLSLSAVNSDAEGLNRALGVLDQLDMAESALTRDMLSARAGLLRDYDPLVHGVKVIDESLAQLHSDVANDADITAEVDRLAAAMRQQEELVERFKSDNALLQNSFAYFGLFSGRLSSWSRNEPMAPAIGSLTTAMLRLTLDTSPAMAQDVEDRLNDLAAQQFPPSDTDSVQGLLAHGRLLHDLLPATDASLKALRALPLKQSQKAVRTLMRDRRAASMAKAGHFQLLLYAASLLLLAALLHFGWRLRARMRDLQRRAALEGVIAGISTRFINVRSHEIGARVEEALGELAAHVGADRAYLLLARKPEQSHLWSRDGVGYSPDWPRRAPELSARLRSARDGIIHIPHCDRLAAGADRDILAAAGLHSWAGVCTIVGDGGIDLLGFDALRGPLNARIAELGLLRMALDAFANALARNSLEQERTRLEARLQQARRMETVGALASGIAHNFNNILGAILGHAEMAEEQVAARRRPDRHLLAIRTAGMRARDLVDQILSFGRRRDGHRRPVNVDALLAETASMLRASLPKQIELVIRRAADPVIVHGEPEQLQQVILNLCNNAVQAMNDEGRLIVETEIHELTAKMVHSHGTSAPGLHLRLAVRDSGHGMEEATRERIFEPFFTTRSAGNGLGLATVQEIVRDHDGSMNVWSAPGVGSRFEAWLPCIAATAAPDRIASSGTLPLGRGETLMLIDDDSVRLMRGEEMLAALGYEPVGFVSPSEALAACRKTPERFDAVVVSHAGSARSALDLAMALRAAAPDLPVVIATASVNEVDADTLAVAGRFEIVRSPLSSAQVAEALKRALTNDGNFAGLLRA
ncbi:two-component system VirA-like sensor kinase [Labrys monachus]|uniref:histidine kinase n=1 Tax=Labrys monachus TaxID=217067 RepID=A0ABU0FBZ5_9HYPH|nr:two-component system VirA-like sensor kinase [Labrys monachus]MDQ0392138.1 signal transduction histidine kinase/CheY-like chemotaxis protein [Labrys monachus]